jgi:hypothetical protein
MRSSQPALVSYSPLSNFIRSRPIEFPTRLRPGFSVQFSTTLRISPPFVQ